MLNPPKTRRKAARTRYGVWGGNPVGFAHNAARCAYEVPCGIFSHQCFRMAHFGPANLYCKQHAKMLED